CQQYSVLPLTF
nr:immunoglobulin light chain junction region [Macaca mulatta]MOX51969.1 immunoglobulin light chain junction region [Macaca mulatta]MOX53328.1 immunoglobulin light chain junction region [Macaca mulatta]MOX53450.1 immunoglobulin light chain junction region [Macaca mulatta]MOX53606.1 immunoglobulin light chain junction region [Macaca mulatta]